MGKQNEEEGTTAALDDQAKKRTRKLLDKQNRLREREREQMRSENID